MWIKDSEMTNITTWQEAKKAGLNQDTLQELCDHDLALKDRITQRLREKHPDATEKQIDTWAWGALRRKFQREHWGFAPY